MSVPLRPLGRTGLEVSAVGLGGGPLGDPSLSDREAEDLLLGALDEGIRLIDTAPSYGRSEERIGRFLGSRRDSVTVSTKLGYGVPGVADWTGECITRGIDLARRRLASDRLDIAHLHSCPTEVLGRGDVVDALAEAVAADTVGVAAYSGDNEPLAWAIADGRFGSVQVSLSPWDQAALDAALPDCRQRGLGVLVKRTLGNAAWSFAAPPTAPDLAELWRRHRALDLGSFGLTWPELALRFSAWQEGVSAVLVGTRHPHRLRDAITAVADGPLPEHVERHVRDTFARIHPAWPGIV